MSHLLPLIISHDAQECKNDYQNNVDFEKTAKELNILANLPSVFNKFPEVQKDEQLKGYIKENHFEVLMDVHQFRPSEIIVKTDKINEKVFVVVEAKHKEQQSIDNFVSRQFIRKYSLPKSCDSRKVIATLSGNGILVVEAPVQKKYSERTM